MKKNSIIIIIVIVTLIGLMSWTLASNKSEINSRKEVKISEDNIAVTVVAAQMQETSNQLELVGTAEPEKEVVVSSKASGDVVKINVKPGDFVSQGTVLAQVDDTYKRLAFENAQVNYNKTKDDYERYQILIEGDAVSERELREMKIAFENAANQLENSKKQLEDTRIVAPFSGVITSKAAELGTYVNAGTPIADMADISRLKVQLAVSESNVYQLRQGQEVCVSANVYPNVTFKGTITSISPQGNGAHTFPVEITIANSDKNPLKAGTYVNARVDMGKTGHALMIPRDAIVSSVKDPSVYVVKGDTVELVKIQTGADYNSYLEVTAGINEGDKIVTNGQINLTDGAKVSVIE